MDWLEELAAQEAELREQLAQLAKRTEASQPPPARPTVEAMQKALDDYLCGRGTDELSWMSQEVRGKLPLFSHLRYLRSLVAAAEARS
jgi:hypothetical protein